MGLSGQVGVHVTLTQTPATALDLSPSAGIPFNYFKNWDITTGVGANQADQAWTDTRTLTTGATEDLDFSGTALQNAYGINIAFVKIKFILIVASSANTTNLTIGNTTATQFVAGFGAATHTWTLTPGDWICVGKQSAAGWAVGAGTTDLFKVLNASGASANYDIIVVGTTA